MRACYQDARFILGATVSGITQAPEGSTHQSVGEPLTGLAQPGLTSFEPAYADERAVLLRWAFEEIQRETGESVYFRLSTRQVDQPRRSTRTSSRRSSPGLSVARAGGKSPACNRLLRCRRSRGAGRLSGGDRGHPGSRAPGDHLARPRAPRRQAARVGGETSVAERLLARLRPGAALVTVSDFHPATLSWLGAVASNTIVPLGVDRFGQSGRHHRSLPRLWHRQRCHSRCPRPRLPDYLAANRMSCWLARQLGSITADLILEKPVATESAEGYRPPGTTSSAT